MHGQVTGFQKEKSTGARERTERGPPCKGDSTVAGVFLDLSTRHVAVFDCAVDSLFSAGQPRAPPGTTERLGKHSSLRCIHRSSRCGGEGKIFRGLVANQGGTDLGCPSPASVTTRLPSQQIGEAEVAPCLLAYVLRPRICLVRPSMTLSSPATPSFLWPRPPPTRQPCPSPRHWT